MIQTFKYPLLCFFVLAIAILGRAEAQQSSVSYEHPERPPSLQELLEWKEKFIYEVRYGFFKVGEVETEIVRDTTYEGKRLWWLRTVITSNSSIPFVGEEENHYNTFFVETDTLPHTRLYWRDNVDEEEYNAERFIFDYEQEKVFLSENGEPTDTLELTEPSTSGQLIFMYSRLFAGTEKTYSLPVYLEGEKGYIDVINSRKTETREYKAFPEAVTTYFTEGDANIEGPFGFSGEFKAWYRADDLRLPLEAHAKVWLGNVKVKLIDYKKERRQR